MKKKGQIDEILRVSLPHLFPSRKSEALLNAPVP